MRVPADTALPHNIMSQHTTTPISRCLPLTPPSPPETYPQIISPQSVPQQVKCLPPTRESCHHLKKQPVEKMISHTFGELINPQWLLITVAPTPAEMNLQLCFPQECVGNSVFFIYLQRKTRNVLSSSKPQITCASTLRPGTFPPRNLVCIATTPKIHEGLTKLLGSRSFYHQPSVCFVHHVSVPHEVDSTTCVS